MPFADLSRFESNPVVQDFGNLLTVNDLCRYVESKVGATAEWAYALVLDRSLCGIRKRTAGGRPEDRLVDR